MYWLGMGVEGKSHPIVKTYYASKEAEELLAEWNVEPSVMLFSPFPSEKYRRRHENPKGIYGRLRVIGDKINCIPSRRYNNSNAKAFWTFILVNGEFWNYYVYNII